MIGLMPVPKILVFAGSIRTGSHNARLAALAAKELALLDADVTRISLEDYELPLFDADLAGDVDRRVGDQRRDAHKANFCNAPERRC